MDGRSVPIQRVDYVLRGVALGPGEHTVVFSYAPASWTIGLIVTGLCLLGVLGAVGTGVAAGAGAAPGDDAQAPAGAGIRGGDGMSESGYTPLGLGERARAAVAQRGARPVIGDLARWATGVATGLPWVARGRPRQL